MAILENMLLWMCAAAVLAYLIVLVALALWLAVLCIIERTHR